MPVKFTGPTLAQQAQEFKRRLAVAMTKAAVATRADLQKEMTSVFDRPTPYTLNAVYLVPATAENPTVEIGLKDAGSVNVMGGRSDYKGGSALTYLQPQIKGGGRALKPYEKLLRDAGILPAGMYTAPGSGAELDGYGNLNPGQLVKILATLKGLKDRYSHSNSPGQLAELRKNMRELGDPYWKTVPDRFGRGIRREEDYVIGGSARAPGLPPGIYRKQGRQLSLVIAFIRAPSYRARFDFEGIARRRFDEHLKANLKLP
jgi:hypothetical protein